MGFSAGGHLAATLGTHFDEPESDVENEMTEISARPDFMVLVYPVISMADEITHMGSRKNLLGEAASQELQDYYSNDCRLPSKHLQPFWCIHRMIMPFLLRTAFVFTKLFLVTRCWSVKCIFIPMEGMVTPWRWMTAT